MYPITRSGLGATWKEWPSMICVVTQLQLMKVLIVLPASTLNRQRSVRDCLSLEHSPDGQLGPGVVVKVGGDGERSRMKIISPLAPLKINVMSSDIFI